MNFKNSILIMKKDWKGALRTKEILAALILMPAIFTIALPIIMMIAVLFDPAGLLAEFPGANIYLQLLNIPAHYNDALKAAVVMIKMMIIPFFLMIPGFTSSFISSDSFAGEKERKTMENIALLPITKTELIVGKIMTSFVPSIIISFTCFIIMGITTNLILIQKLDGNILIFTDLADMLICFLLSPILSILFIQVSIIISSRSKSVKSAQSISGSLIVPIIAIFIIQMINPAFLSPIIIIIFSAIIGILCLFFIWLGNRLLDIERLILTL